MDAQSGPTQHRKDRKMLAKAPDRASEFLEALARLVPTISQHRTAFDNERRLPNALFEALADAGLFRLWLPTALGGPELSPIDFMAVVETASSLDGSVGWLVGNGAGMSRIGGYLPHSVARSFFSNSRAFVTSSTAAVGAALRVDGGYRVSGRWPFGSGAHHASHFMGLACLRDADGNEEPPLCCYFERRDVVIHDTWRVSGLRATGSCDFEVRDLFVPEQHTHLFMEPPPTQDGIVYALPTVCVFGWTVATVPLGIARGAMNVFVEHAGRRARQSITTVLRDREIVQGIFGRADALHRAARAFLIEAMSKLIAVRSEGGPSLVEARVVFRAAATHAAESAIRVVEMLAAESGSIAIFETSPMERFVRDVHAAAKHVAMSPNNYVLSGRVGLGLDPGTKRF